MGVISCASVSFAAAKETLAQEITPIDDMRSTAAYRLRVAQNLLEEFLLQLQNNGGDESHRGLAAAES